MRRYESLFGQPYYDYAYDWLSVDGSESDKNATASRSHSETNVQVAGVDEGDIIETDGDYLYILTGSELIIAAAWPAESLSIASRQTVRGTPLAEFLHGDRLAVISQVQEIVPWWNDTPPQLAADAAAAGSRSHRLATAAHARYHVGDGVRRRRQAGAEGGPADRTDRGLRRVAENRRPGVSRPPQ